MKPARIIRLQSTVSTMLEAASLAAAGEPHGTVVVAERQTGGIGRHGHTWASDPGGLYFSMVLRLSLPPDQFPVLTMAIGLAVQSALNAEGAVAADLRWPNDVLISERKLAGILVQSAGDALVAGIGVNVNQTSFPAEIVSIATSLVVETGRTWDKDLLLPSICAEIDRFSQLLVHRGRREVFRLFTEHSSYVEGKRVEVDLGSGSIQGITAGLDENGFLVVLTPEGKRTVVAGGVRATLC